MSELVKEGWKAQGPLFCAWDAEVAGADRVQRNLRRKQLKRIEAQRGGLHQFRL